MDVEQEVVVDNEGVDGIFGFEMLTYDAWNTARSAFNLVPLDPCSFHISVEGYRDFATCKQSPCASRMHRY
jgi:hypothetical protein